MLSNNLTIAWRTIVKHKTFSLLNIAGLTLGLAALYYIAVYIYHEASYDTYHRQADRIYRVLQIDTTADGPRHGVAQYSPLAAVFKESIPEIEKLARLEIPRQAVFNYQNTYFSENSFYWADQELLDIFDLPMVYGNPRQALKEPGSLLITQTIARKYFGKTNVLGEVLQLDTLLLTITGVLEDLPSNTHLPFTMLGSYTTLGEATDPWTHQGSMYLLAKAHTSPQVISGKLTSQGKAATWWLKDPPSYTLQPVKAIHLYSTGFLSPTGGGNDVKYLYIFGAVALLIALSTSFNYVTMATARFAHRAKEVGIRKVIGASRGSLIGQLLWESLWFSLIAMLLALTLLQLFLPYINRLVEVEFTRHYLQQSLILGILLGLTLLLGIVAGIYPSLFLSRFGPKHLLKGIGKIQDNRRLREVLIVLQFFITATLVISTFIVREQLQYMSTKKLGFHPEQLLVLTTPKNILPVLPVVSRQLMSLSGVGHVSASIASPLQAGLKNVEEIAGRKWNVALINADTAFISTLGIDLIQGRNFSTQLQRDGKEAVIVNETLVKAFGWKQPLEQVLKMSENRRVIGVVKDFHTGSLHEPILPIMITADPEFFFPHRMLFVRIQTKNVLHTVEAIKNTWHQYAPAYPLTATFLDEQYQALYQSEVRLQGVIGLFSLLAVCIGSLGLFGLTVFMTEQRTKEIGIRKVLGASVGSLMSLLSKDLLRLVLVASLLALPVAWFIMHKWLEEFAYRIELSAWSLLYPVLGLLVSAILITGYQTWKVARDNPVKVLKYE